MPPLLKTKQSLTRDRFSAYFAPYKSQTYNDPAATRGTTAHGCVLFSLLLPVTHLTNPSPPGAL